MNGLSKATELGSTQFRLFPFYALFFLHTAVAILTRTVTRVPPFNASLSLVPFGKAGGHQMKWLSIATELS
jgi:hypothetical protein